jgi:large subunit ribosomal protein L17
MRHQKQGRKLSRRKEHRKSMLANLASSLILHGRIKTTDAKAKEVRPFVERMVTFARRGDLHARRIVLSRLRNTTAVKKLFDEIGPQFANRFGGYTRIVKLGFRHGDNSPVSLIEFVSEEETTKAPKRKKKATKKAEPKKAATKVEDTKAAVETPVEEAAAEPVAEETQSEEVVEDAAEVAEETAVEAEEAPAEDSGDDAAESDEEKK